MEGYEFCAVGNGCLLTEVLLSWELLPGRDAFERLRSVCALARAGTAAVLESKRVSSIECSAGNLNSRY